MKRKRRPEFDDDDDDAYPSRSHNHAPARARPQRRRGLRRLVTFVVFLAVVVALLPTIVAKTPLRNTLLAAVLPKQSVQVSIGDASLGWFSAPSVSAIEVRDAAGRPLATIESIRVDRSPWALATNRNDLGAIEIQRPTVYLAARPDGSNLEDVINQLLGAAQPAGDAVGPATTAAPPPLPAFAIRVTEGTILAEDMATARRWRIQNLNVQYDSHGVAGGLGPLAVSGRLDAGVDGVAPANGAMPAGGFAMSLATAADGRQQFQFQAESLMLAAVEPMLRRYVTGIEFGGALSGQGTAAWTEAKPQAVGQPIAASLLPGDLTTSGSLRIDSLDVSAPALAGDRLRFDRVDLPWQITAQPTGLVIENLQLHSDAGRIAVRGTIDSTALAPLGGAAPVEAVAAGRHDVEVLGELDVAKLAAMLPHAMRIRNDTRITSGTLQLSARAQPIEAGEVISGSVQTAQLAATSGGRPLTWDQPITAAFDLRRENGTLRLNSLKCESEFLAVDAAGTVDQVTANAKFDLDRLAKQLGQFVDLSRVELSGTGTAHIDWHQAGANRFTAAANSDISQLRVALDQSPVWTEPRLAIKAEAAGASDPATYRPTQVGTAQVQIDADGGDQFDAKLTAPVDCAAVAPVWPVNIRLTGDIARWMTWRCNYWFAPGPWQIGGQSEVTADVRAAAAGPTVDVANAKVAVSNLHVVGVGWNISEPRVELAGDLRWDGATGEIVSQTAQLVSSTISLASKGVQLRTSGPGSPQVNGVAAFRADLGRVGAWRDVPGQTAPFRSQGMVSGNVRFVQQSDRITGELTATGQNLVLAQWIEGGSGDGNGSGPGTARLAGVAGYQTIWQEPQVSLRGSTAYEMAADRLAFQQIQLQSNTVSANVDGQIDKLRTAGDVNANGTVNYDLAQITSLLRPYVGNGVQLTGRETAKVQVVGQLGAKPQAGGLRGLQARMEAPWESANVYGLPIGGGKIAAALADGTVRVDPIALAVAEGRLTTSPVVRLDPEPMELTLPPGPVLTDVRISPEVSEAMLKYIAPVLAGATQSEGTFSLALENGARVPLREPKLADAAGQFTVHSVRVVPGPMAKQWVDLAQQIEALAKRRDPTSLAQRAPATLLTVQDQQVNFRVVDGRVHHQGMDFQVGDVTLHSEGSVGFDETLQLVLKIPIQDKWIEGQNFLVGLKGQSLSIPISGTLARPQMDQRAVASLSQQLLQGAAQQAIGGEVNKALDKFFKPR